MSDSNPAFTEVTREIVMKVVRAMVNGAPASRTLRELNCDIWDFYRYVNDTPDLQIMYETAQIARAETIVEEIIDIADNDDSQKARNRIDSRKWYAAKMRPSKYGEKLDINMTQIVDITSALNEAKSRIAGAAHSVVLPISYPTIDVAPITISNNTDNNNHASDCESDDPSNKSSDDPFD